MNRKAGQLLIVGLRGPSLTAEESEFIIRNNIGGVVLFQRNLKSPEQLHELCRDLQNLRQRMPDKSPLFIGMDMEGGRVARLKEPFTQWPSPRQVGDLDSTLVAFHFAHALGSEMRSVGLNLNFAPSAEILINRDNRAIGDRSFGEDGEKVGRLASAFVRGLIKADVIACAKHFPGHGNSSGDSHEILPRDERSYEEVLSTDGVPFKKVFRARLDMVMSAHVMFPKIDSEWPASLSERILGDLLREELKYRCISITDDMDMKAITENYSVEEAALQALMAGSTMLLYCNDFSSPPKALQAIERALKDKVLSSALIDENFKKVQDLKKKKLASPDPKPLMEAARIVGSAENKELAKAIAEGQIPVGLLGKEGSED